MSDEFVNMMYRYRHFAPPYGRESIERAIRDNELYYSCPTAFNDPFDCNPVTYFGDSTRERLEFAERANKRINKPRNGLERRRFAAQAVQVSQEMMERETRRMFAAGLSGSSVACFSETPDHPLMWGHYANSHRGVCLIYRQFNDGPQQWVAQPVTYSADRPRINLVKMRHTQVTMLAICHKAEDWAYEQERRIFRWRIPEGYVRIPDGALLGVILGAKILEDDEAIVRTLVAGRDDLTLWRARIDDEHFKLNIERA